VAKKNGNEKEKEITYPLDVWFLISEYIQPEAVGKFASICRYSYYVSNTATFWFNLIKRLVHYLIMH